MSLDSYRRNTLTSRIRQREISAISRCGMDGSRDRVTRLRTGSILNVLHTADLGILASEDSPDVFATGNSWILGARILDSCSVEEISGEHSGFLVVGETNLRHSAADISTAACQILEPVSQASSARKGRTVHLYDSQHGWNQLQNKVLVHNYKLCPQRLKSWWYQGAHRREYKAIQHHQKNAQDQANVPVHVSRCFVFHFQVSLDPSRYRLRFLDLFCLQLSSTRRAELLYDRNLLWKMEEEVQTYSVDYTTSCPSDRVCKENIDIRQLALPVLCHESLICVAVLLVIVGEC